MSYDTRVTGAIHIVPPLPWNVIRDNSIIRGQLPGSFDGPRPRGGRGDLDVRVHVEETEVDTPDGFLIRREGTAIVPTRGEGYGYRDAYDLTSHVSLVARMFPDRAFEGHLECRSGDDTWRVIVRNGVAHEVRPTLTWPYEMSEVAADVATRIASRVRAELVCCNIYAQVNDAKTITFEAAQEAPGWHPLCYWGEAAARIADIGGA